MIWVGPRDIHRRARITLRQGLCLRAGIPEGPDPEAYFFSFSSFQSLKYFFAPESTSLNLKGFFASSL